jgi:hypothetical protein
VAAARIGQNRRQPGLDRVGSQDWTESAAAAARIRQSRRQPGLDRFGRWSSQDWTESVAAEAARIEETSKLSRAQISTEDAKDGVKQS